MVLNRFFPLSVFLVLAACLGAPTLITFHGTPQTVFVSESVAAGLFLLAGILSVFVLRETTLRLGLPLLAAGVLVVGIVGQLAWGHPVLAVLSGSVVYLGLFALAYLMGQCRHASNMGDRLTEAVAWGLLACAVAQSFAGFVQLSGKADGFWVMHKLFRLVFGNIGQANHYADLLWLGMAGAVYLWVRERLPLWAFVPVVGWVALASAASASRGVWFYTAAFGVLALWSAWAGWRGNRAAGRAALGVGFVVLVSVAVQLLVTYGGIFKAFDVTSSIARAGDSGSNGQRWHDWHVAMEAVRAHPWGGAGVGSFYRLTIESAIAGPYLGFPMLAEHAHNLVFHLTAELGLPCALAALGALAIWGLRQLFSTVTPARLFALSGLAVVGLHSMVEYPLWYTYFMIPTGLLFGIADAESETLPVLNVPRKFMIGALSVAALVFAWILWDCYVVGWAQAALGDRHEGNTVARMRARAQMASLPALSLFSGYAHNQVLLSWTPTREGAPAMARQCDAYWKDRPEWAAMIQCGVAYAAVPDERGLNDITTTLCRAFPAYHGLLRDWVRDSVDLGPLHMAGRACIPAVP